MAITLGGWILIGILFLFGVLFSVFYFINNEEKTGFIVITVTIILVIGIALISNWYNSNTADGIRNYNTYKSNMHNGIERTIDIYNAEGELRYHFEGVVDVDDSGDYELFYDTQDGQRVIIHYGIQDLVVIQSKGIE